MRGAIDEECMRLARALQRPPQAVDEALQEVGVDAPYLARALLEGDPDGVIATASHRLGVSRRQLAVALLRSSMSISGARARPAVADPERPRRALRRAALAAAVLGAALVAFAATFVWSPGSFREILLAGAAVLSALLGALLMVAAWRFARDARRLGRLR